MYLYIVKIIESWTVNPPNQGAINGGDPDPVIQNELGGGSTQGESRASGSGLSQAIGTSAQVFLHLHLNVKHHDWS